MGVVKSSAVSDFDSTMEDTVKMTSKERQSNIARGNIHAMEEAESQCDNEKDVESASARESARTDDFEHDGTEVKEMLLDTGDDSKDVIIEYESNDGLIYGVCDSPPLYITVACGLQHALVSLSTQLIISLLVAEAVCASQNDVIKARLLSSTLLMNGVTTITMNFFGIRMPLLQGASSEYVVPLIVMSSLTPSFCSVGQDPNALFANVSSNASEVEVMVTKRIVTNITALQGSLMVAGLVHVLLGFTGLLGLLLRFVGPITIVPTLTLTFIFLVTPALQYVESSWPIAISTATMAIILSLYMARFDTPIPVWTPSRGFRIIRYPLHKMLSILISILINWGICAALTSAGMFTDNPDNVQFKARTDARSDIIYKNPWFTLPYPGQFGPFGISVGAVVCFIIATLTSIFESIGGYYAIARVCRVPPPPLDAMNRGVLIEGVSSFLAGTMGCGHATATYSSNIGAVGITKVASRSVFIVTGIFHLLFALFGKFSAIFITIPYPVLGGAILFMFGVFIGVNLTNLQGVSLTSSRNAAILGLSIFVGLMVPTWIQRTEDPINTGNEDLDQYIAILLGNPNFCGTILAFTLDNTLPGTREERGLAAWHVSDEDENTEVDKNVYNAGYEVYTPPFMGRLSRHHFMKYVPFLPYRRQRTEP